MSVAWPADSEPESCVSQKNRAAGHVQIRAHVRVLRLQQAQNSCGGGLAARRTVLARSARVGKVLDGNISPTSVLAVLFMSKIQ